jgi:hypothetical protein
MAAEMCVTLSTLRVETPSAPVTISPGMERRRWAVWGCSPTPGRRWRSGTSR